LSFFNIRLKSRVRNYVRVNETLIKPESTESYAEYEHVDDRESRPISIVALPALFELNVEPCIAFH